MLWWCEQVGKINKNWLLDWHPAVVMPFGLRVEHRLRNFGLAAAGLLCIFGLKFDRRVVSIWNLDFW